MATEQELFQTIAELQAENKKLKQSGNCKYFNNYTDRCKLDEFDKCDYYSYMTCDKWEWQVVM